MNTDAARPDAILLCRCAEAGRIPIERIEAVARAAGAAGVELAVLSDLCRSAVLDAAAVRSWAARGGRRAVVACHERAVRWLFHRAGVTQASRDVVFINARTSPIEATLALLDLARIEDANVEPLPGAPEIGEWPAWFPVLDYDRCARCRQCVDFCLFGVYEWKENRVDVVAPRACKNNCPACARICPAQAIIFPKSDIPEIYGVARAEAVKATAGGGEVGNSGTGLSGETIERLLERRRQRAEAFRRARTAKAERDACLSRHGGIADTDGARGPERGGE